MEQGSATADRGSRTWHSRDLAAVLLVLYGVWTLVQVALFWASWLRTDPPWDARNGWSFAPWQVALLVLEPAIGIALLLGGRRLAAVLFRGPERTPASVEVVSLLAAGLAAIGLVTAFEQVDALVRVLLPFVDRGLNQPIPLREVCGDVLTGGLGVWLFVRSGAIARSWGRWNGIA